ncbi:MAG: acetyl-CoA carboxylase biotin carboxyl carrier protein [Victivallales bacterium]|jgi:acetyl-CoA carboxylase biotin carboxyl carrier protein|nr:acetyl-CoA carboxylase biotin carboxyl carrier protein [Victivallales bacterium]
MKIEEIKTIVKLMSDHDLTEFKIEAEEYNLCIRRGGNAPTQILTHVAPAPVAAVAPASTPAASNPVAMPEAPAQEAAETIDSPLVGTFYRASSPDAKPFVKIGDKVTADTVVGIIEAMKVMNEIKAEKSGVIKEIVVENGQPVEYGEALFVIA